MKQYQIADAKSHFSEVLAFAESGEAVEIIRGKKRKPVAYIIPPDKMGSMSERSLGTLMHWGEISISNDWTMTNEELLES